MKMINQTEKILALGTLNNKVYYYFSDETGCVDLPQTSSETLRYPQTLKDVTHVSNSLFSTVSYEQDLIAEANIKVVKDMPRVLVYSKWQQTVAYLPIKTESDYQSTLSILQSLETYPCLDDEVWSALEAEAIAFEWEQWGKDDFVDGMAKKFSNCKVAEILDGTGLWALYSDLVVKESDGLDIGLALTRATQADWARLKPCLDLY